MTKLSGLQCPSCKKFIYDWANHVECLFNAVMRLNDEVAELREWNTKLRRILNEDPEG